MSELSYHVRKMLALLELGKTFEDCRKILKLNQEEFAGVQKECCKLQAKKWKAKSKEEIYSEYVVEQKKCLAALNKLIERMPNDGSAKGDASLLNAIKVKSDIEDKIIEKGQELGILEKFGKKSDAVRQETRDEMRTSKMRDEDLRDSVTNEEVVLERIMQTFQNQSLSEVDSPPIYRTVSKPIDIGRPELEKHHKAKISRVHAGRPGFLRYKPDREDGNG